MELGRRPSLISSPPFRLVTAQFFIAGLAATARLVPALPRGVWPCWGGPGVSGVGVLAVNAPHFQPREKCGFEHTGHNLWGRDLLVVQWQWKGEAGEAEGKK